MPGQGIWFGAGTCASSVPVFVGFFGGAERPSAKRFNVPIRTAPFGAGPVMREEEKAPDGCVVAIEK